MDIDNDGIDDIISGEYYGKITLYKGLKNGGVHAPTEIEQKTDIKDEKNYYDVIYTNPNFGDYNGDGLLDVVVGGAKGYRIMLNIGTKEKPVLDIHKPILDIEGNQIFHRKVTAEDFKGLSDKNFTTPDYMSHAYLIDWDNDGVVDIITTTSYCNNLDEAINFHKGIETDKGIRFNKSIPLFTGIGGNKSLPGKFLRAYITDINNDGTLDIMLGVSAYTDDNGIPIPELNNLYEYDDNIHNIRSEYIVKNNIKKIGTHGFVITLLGNKHYK